MQETAIITVIITCYNQANFLSAAIKSVLEQTVKAFEIIVVDDGSTDKTNLVVKQFPEVKYIQQVNSGLPAARNTGWKYSSSNYLVFLDADDVLLPNALEAGLETFKLNPELAFVSGHFHYINESGNYLSGFSQNFIEKDYYTSFLKGNYIGMHAAVMYRRFALELTGGFDASLNACEDYDLYLRVSRLYPVRCHRNVIAGYRMHANNLSGNHELMLKTVLNVLNSQKKYLNADRSLKKAFKLGLKNWTAFYGLKLFYQVFKLLFKGDIKKSAAGFLTLIRYSPYYFLNIMHRNN